ncbi:MAG: GNAT family N-acetyltransferase [Pseudomonadota bacterium]
MMVTNETRIEFRNYRSENFNDCLKVFEANTPNYFAQCERAEFISFLETQSDCYSTVWFRSAEDQNVIEQVGGFGIANAHNSAQGNLHWIMILPRLQGQGIGVAIMNKVIEETSKMQLDQLAIAASHLSAPFFERWGAKAQNYTKHGWGENMHRIDMLIDLAEHSSG